MSERIEDKENGYVTVRRSGKEKLSDHIKVKDDNWSIASKNKLKASQRHKMRRIFVGTLEVLDIEKANGTIELKDILSGKVIPTGAGILEQINNYSTYSSLTYNYLQNTVANALFGQSDTDGMSITLHTGRGGMREFDSAMKEAGVTNMLIAGGGGNIADKFVGGSNYNLVSMGFFDAMYHIDGYYIKVKHNAIFDYGRRAVKSPLHPETGYPLESYRMVFIDDGMYDGEANLQMVAEEGRRFLHGVVPGLSPLPRQYKILQGVNSGTSISGANLALLATDVDKSSYHRLMVGGCQLRRGNTSLHLECIAGLS